MINIFARNPTPALITKQLTKQLTKSNDFIDTMYNETAFEKQEVKLVLTANGICYVLDNKIQADLSDDDIKVFKNFLRLGIKKAPVKEVEEKVELDELDEDLLKDK